MGLSTLIPASLVADTDDLRSKTYKIGQIARAASVFRCDEIVVYEDDPDESEVISLVLEYAVTPPYLRKDAFEKRDELRYVGVIPPLRIPPHMVLRQNESEYRQGVVTKVGSDGRVWVNCGTQHPVALRIPDPEDLCEGERVTLRISSRDPLRADIIDPSEVPQYWGYEVTQAPLDEWLDTYEDIKIATSRKGERFDEECFGEGEVYSEDKDVAVAFGSPDRGIDGILEGYYEDASIDEFDLVVNTIPNQGTETVRTEEAVFASLALINVTRN